VVRKIFQINEKGEMVMIKKAGLLSAVFVLGLGVSTGLATVNLFEEDIDKVLVPYGQQAKERVSHAESNAIAQIVVELEDHKNKEIQRGKDAIDKAVETKIQSISSEYQREIADDKVGITEYVDSMVDEITKEINEM
jgi:hypothetical protein